MAILDENELKKMFKDFDNEEAEIISISNFKPEKYKPQCCHCCSAVSFVQYLVLNPKDNKYYIIRHGIDDDFGYGNPCFSHDNFENGKHPFSEFESIFENDPNNGYYKFIRQKLLDNPIYKKEFNLKAGSDEWSQFYWIIKYLKERNIKFD